jgi:hypothetical protein
VRYLYTLSKQPSTNVDTRGEVIRPQRLHLLEVVGVKMLIVQNLPYQHVLYTQGVCSASCTSIRLLFKTLDYCFFKVWCMAPPQMSTAVFVRSQAACFTLFLLLRSAMSCLPTGVLLHISEALARKQSVSGHGCINKV